MREFTPVSYSKLSRFKKSPAHLYSYLREDRDFGRSPAMAIGSAFHCKLLEPDSFDQRYIVIPKISKNSKAGKEEYEQFVQSAAGRELISVDDYETVCKMNDSVQKSSACNQYLQEIGEVEKKVNWTDAVWNLPMVGVVDAVCQDFIIDVKTCQDAGEWFKKDIFNNNYHLQAAMYVDAYDANRDFYFLAVEKTEPFGCQLHKLDVEVINYAREKYRGYLNEYKAWLDMGAPEIGYEFFNLGLVNHVKLPTWMR